MLGIFIIGLLVPYNNKDLLSSMFFAISLGPVTHCAPRRPAVRGAVDHQYDGRRGDAGCRDPVAHLSDTVACD
jgi:hypothetical protein